VKIPFSGVTARSLSVFQILNCKRNNSVTGSERKFPPRLREQLVCSLQSNAEITAGLAAKATHAASYRDWLRDIKCEWHALSLGVARMNVRHPVPR